MKQWSHLPNAQLIDWVLRSLKENSELWEAARVAQDASYSAVRDAAWYATCDATCDADRGAAWDAVWEAAGKMKWYVARNAGWSSTCGVIAALIAYDDCDQYLAMTYERLLTYAILSEKPQALLLLTLKWVQEHETMGTLT